MPVIADPTILSGLTLLVSLGAGYLAMKARSEVHRAREAQLREAVSLLQLHCNTLERLDDDEMPAGLLELAIQLSRILHDPDVSRRTRDRILQDDAADALSNRGPKSERVLAETDAFMSLMSRRPDLAIAFAQCLATGLLSFERRWPECEGRIAPGAPRIIASPMEEAQRVVRAAERFPDWPGSVGAAAA